MTSRHLQQADILQNRYGLRVAARLSAGAAELPHDISERLRASRERAVALRKKPVAVARLQPASTVVQQGPAAALTFGDDGMGPWGRATSAAVVIALAAGLFAIDVVQRYNRASEAADVDAALLTDDLPPAAYTDPGFLQFLRTPRADAPDSADLTESMETGSPAVEVLPANAPEGVEGSNRTLEDSQMSEPETAELPVGAPPAGDGVTVREQAEPPLGFSASGVTGRSPSHLGASTSLPDFSSGPPDALGAPLNGSFGHTVNDAARDSAERESAGSSRGHPDDSSRP